jgi:hypothetical protein
MLEFDGNFLQRREHIKTCLLKIIPVRQEGGYLYGDKINARVQMFDNEGNYLTGWGSFGKDPEQLNQPEDIAVGKGLIYVTDTRKSRIQILEIKN